MSGSFTGHGEGHGKRQRKNITRTYLDKEYEMLEGCIKMCFLPKLYHFTEVLVVDVCIHPEESFQYCLGITWEVLWKWNTCKMQEGVTGWTYICHFYKIGIPLSP